MRIVTVIGNRPQFVKAAAVSHRLRERASEILVHTGQHYDDDLSRVFFDELELPRPEHRLELGGGSNAAQTARMLTALEPLLAAERPDAVLVYGDTNSTLARALADHAASLLLCSSRAAAQTLRDERVAGEIVEVGDVMVDVFALLAPRADTATLARLGVEPREYLLVTAHRAGNVDDPERLRALVALLRALPAPVVLPLHPRTRARLEAASLTLDAVVVVPPLGYLEFMALLLSARRVLTDSGGVQKEAYLAGVPCITLRPTTEWRETVAAGWNVLVDLDAAAAPPPPAREPPATR